MRITECSKCRCPILRADNLGLPWLFDLEALDAPEIARAWIEGRLTYMLATSALSQSFRWYPATRDNRDAVIDLITKRLPIPATVLTLHCCTTATADRTLATWQEKDRQFHQPRHLHATTTLGAF
jgi:hypothetical protein